MLNDPTGDPNQYRPLRAVRRAATWRGTTQYQNYHSLQALLSRQTSKFSMTASYTFSKALGIRGGGQGAVVIPPGDPATSRTASSATTARHVLQHRLQLAAARHREQPAAQRHPRRLAADGRLDLHQRRAAAAAGEHRQQLRPGRHQRQRRHHRQCAVLPASPHITVQPLLTCDPDDGLSGDQILNPNCFTLPTPGRAGHVHLPVERPRAGLHQQRLRGVQELQPRWREALPVPRLVHQRVQPSAARARGQQQPEAAVHERRADNQNFGILPQNNKYGRRIIQLAFKYYF